MSLGRVNIPPISVQLYSLREASEQDFDHVLASLADIGYKGVEPFNLFGKSPRQFRRQVEDLGMQVGSTHFPWMNRTDDIASVVEVLGELGLQRAPGGFGPRDFQDMDAVKRATDTTAAMVEALRPHGITLCLHNHWWEFNTIDGQIAYHYLQDQVPDVEFEIDTYWAANFGACDPAAELARVSVRTPLAHIKDGPLQPDQAQVAVGEGTMHFAPIFAATHPDVFEWAIVELDACDTDMMTAVADSYTYLTTHNLAQGNV